ncbi:MAG TPA: class I tRNA ligase family protein, partial [bacterium]|nr:class I tRNA ligase family protein [bacterium]
MSKSKGNAIDPLELIKDFGCDAMRFTLTALAAQGRDIKLSYSRLEGYRHFLNKIWNASRFVFMNYSDDITLLEKLDYEKLSLADKWILRELNLTIKTVNETFDNYRFNEAANALYDFFWKKYCDWYIEISKPILFNGAIEEKNIKMTVLLECLNSFLKLLHPIMPFITEEIWQKLPQNYRDAESIMISEWPKINENYINDSSVNQMDLIIDIITNIRNIANQMNVPPSQKVNVFLVIKDHNKKSLINDYCDYIILLAKVEELKILDDFVADDTYGAAALPNINIFVDADKKIDIAAEREKLNNLIVKAQNELAKIIKKIENQEFLETDLECVICAVA